MQNRLLKVGWLLVYISCTSNSGITTYEGSKYYGARYIDTATIIVNEYYFKFTEDEGFHSAKYNYQSDDYYLTEFNTQTGQKKRLFFLGGGDTGSPIIFNGWGDTLICNHANNIYLYNRQSGLSTNLNIHGSYPCFLAGQNTVYYISDSSHICKYNLQTGLSSTILNKPNIADLAISIQGRLFVNDKRLNEVWSMDTNGQNLSKIYTRDIPIQSIDVAKDGSEVLLYPTMFIVFNDSLNEIRTYEDYYHRSNIVVGPARYSFVKTVVVGSTEGIGVQVVDITNGATSIFK